MRSRTSEVAFAMLLAAVCVQAGEPCNDVDLDGFFFEAGCGTAQDCNDADPQIYPGATELCDGFDNNCNSATDENSFCNCSSIASIASILLFSSSVCFSTSLA